MAIDEKMINQEMYTVMTNSDTGKIAMLAETMESKELEPLLKKLNAAPIIKNITGDLSPMYESLCKKALPETKMTADKFHVVSHSLDMLQDIRIRYKHEEIAKMPKKKKERELYEQNTMVENGETRRELLSKSRYLLYKRKYEWSQSQQNRAQLLFKYYPELETAYELVSKVRTWYNHKTTNTPFLQIESKLYEWYEIVEKEKIPEMNNLVKTFIRHEENILNYFQSNKTNAIAEAVNGKIQRFISFNYGVRDKDFFLFRIAKYYS